MSELRTDESDPRTLVTGLLPRSSNDVQLSSPTNLLLTGGQQLSVPQTTSTDRPNIPPELNVLMGDIRKRESGDRNILYGPGNKPVPPGGVIPGAIGPTGQPTHAFSEYEFQPGTWNRMAQKAIDSGRQPLNYENRDDRDWAAVELAKDDYKTRTGRDLVVDARSNTIDKSALSATWTSLRMQHPSLAAMQQSVDKIQQGKYREANTLTNAVNELTRGIGEEKQQFGESMTRIRAAQDKADEANDAALKASQKQPQQPELDGIKNFSGIATVVGILGGLFTRQPLQASLNAAGAAMEAYNAKDIKNYDIAYNSWKANTDLLFKIAANNANRVRNIMADETMELNERHHLLDVTLRGVGLQRLADEVRTSGPEVALDVAEKIFAADNKKEESLARIEQTNYRIQQQFNAKPDVRAMHDQLVAQFLQSNPQYNGIIPVEADISAWQQANSAAKTPSQGTPSRKTEEELFQNLQQARESKDPEKIQTAQQSIADHNLAKGKTSTQELWSQDAMDALVERASKGDPTVMQQLPRSGPARRQYEEALAKRLKQESGGIEGGNAQMIMNRLRMVEATSAARRAGSITMNTELFAQEATLAGKEVVRTSNLVPRTELPTINTALNAFYTNTGDPSIIEFGVAVNALYNAYGKMSNPTGTGIHDIDKIRIEKILNTALAKGQIEGGVEQVIREGRIISTAAETAQQDVLQRLAPVPQTSRPSENVIVPTPQAPIATPTTATALPVPSEHNSDPDGTKYNGSDGKTYVKRGNKMVPE